MNFQKIFSQLLELFFPVTCLSCPASGTYLCGRCKATLIEKQKLTVLRTQAIQSVYIGFDYRSPVPQLIKILKYKYCEPIVETIVELMAHQIKDVDWHVDFLVPVPLHPNRKKSRGFNQSELLCQVLRAHLLHAHPKLKVVNLLTRVIDTPHQAHLSRSERLLNVKNAFVIDEKIAQKFNKRSHILLVDDVYTTGSTVSECALTMKKYGIDNVSCLVFAKKLV